MASKEKDDEKPLLKDEDTQGDSEKDSANPMDPNYVSMKKTGFRWCMLIMACFFMFGNTFCYDTPGPIET
jgi:hypothetical protein